MNRIPRWTAVAIVPALLAAGAGPPAAPGRLGLAGLPGLAAAGPARHPGGETGQAGEGGVRHGSRWQGGALPVEVAASDHLPFRPAFLPRRGYHEAAMRPEACR